MMRTPKVRDTLARSIRFVTEPEHTPRHVGQQDSDPRKDLQESEREETLLPSVAPERTSPKPVPRYLRASCVWALA